MVCAGGFMAMAQENQADPRFSLAELAELLEKNSLKMQISRYDVQLADEELKSGRRLPNPHLELSRGRASLLEKPDKKSVWGIGVNMAIPNFASRHFQIKGLKYAAAEADMARQIQFNQLLKELKQAVFTLNFQQKKQAVLTNELESMKKILAITELKKKLGEVRELDVIRVQMEALLLENEVADVSRQIASGKTTINAMLNGSLPADFEIQPNFPFAPIKPLETDLQKYESSIPLLIQMKLIADKNRQFWKSAQFNWLDGVDVFLEKEREIEATIVKFGLGLELPLLNQHAAERRYKRYGYEKSQAEWHDIRNQITEQLTQLLISARFLEKQIEIYQQTEVNAEQMSWQVSESLYKNGEIDLINLLDARKKYYTFSLHYEELITDWLICKAGLESIIGEEL
jgi:outer membrane protein TolC